MVTNYETKIRNKLDKKIFQSAAFDPKVVTLIKKSSPVYNTEDEITSYTSDSSEVVGVPYDLIQGRYAPQPWGKVTEGDGSIAFRYDTDVEEEDIVIIEGVNYKVVDFDPNYLPGSVVKICTLSRIIGDSIN